tara:strand:+ start:537 stop:824 length:288 start_codon:yes stop_codon:yes gene_type:complete
MIKNKENTYGIGYVKVKNINNRPNQFIITTPDAEYFQSYESVIAMRTWKKTYLDINYWDYSTTTGKYRNIFLNENKKLTETKIKNNTYLLANLNQ